ncbi:MAG: c-type cytochrome [Methylocystis sp.]|uniref:c-type cytochrome n=1 Tax=Methylocystis sp. TaxID=1911079 RepID=UPI003DA2EC3A
MKRRSLESVAVLLALTLAPQAADARPARHAPAPQQAPQPAAQNGTPPPSNPPPRQTAPIVAYGAPSQLLEAPVSALLPGNTGPRPQVVNPVENNPEAIQRGMNYFNMFNCSGCHAPNAGGGMGPSLSNRFFIYGGAPQNVYLSIYQGRPNGMPSWGAMLPEEIIWDLVAYIRSISSEPTRAWGQTFSHEAFSIEQVPAEFAKTATPWSETERFSFGQKPNGKR